MLESLDGVEESAVHTTEMSIDEGSLDIYRTFEPCVLRHGEASSHHEVVVDGDITFMVEQPVVGDFGGNHRELELMMGSYLMGSYEGELEGEL